MALLARLRSSRFPVVALASLLVLLIAGIAIAVVNEQALRVQTARAAGAQADLLASAVSGALAFDDRAAAQDYVDAVQVNPSVLAAAVYDERGRMVASFVRDGETIFHSAASIERETLFDDGNLLVARPVEEAGQKLGVVHLKLLETPPAQRFSRYAGLLLVLGLAGLVVIVLAVAQGALRRANRQLADRAAELVQANSLLQQQMIEREKAEEALRQSQKMEAIGRLTGGIAHDFNNLLMVASSGIELLDRTEDAKRRASLSAGVKQAVERGAALTRQLLAFSRRSPLKAEVLDVRAHIESLRFLLERSLREDIEVVLDLPEGLWPVEADRGELELALLNLAVNARDAMPQGGRLIISASNAEAAGEAVDMVCLRVADTGAGMPEAVALRVFEPFFTTKEVGRGTGLGLSQVYGFVKSSGGEISVESREGQGTTFTLCLPRTDKTPPAPAEAVKAPARDGAAGARNANLRLLLVEDDDAVAAGVGHMLDDLGYTHVRVASAAEALEVLEQDPGFDLIFSDMVMPGEMDGLGLAQEVRRRLPATPVLLTTGFSEAASAATGEAFRLLPKPYGIDSLSEALEDTLAERDA
ncbi:signal transduction histidine kinase/ActR/RegA family two-component response regulator [Brevundimonas alba]|uniref:histidine kinase n=1 Tax=Brevundimonas alba TaxID=74314 RepID=A0A7X5YL67_9CAUL|nr:ATP-binding protein [Brevundimonas alba]NJC40555.1 signal transduction histidine kinase/ActR/RegA family two-component response regulator [Brevundimonas alba]